MFVHMSLHYPLPGKENFIIQSMHRFAAAMAGRPGLLKTHVLRDANTGKLVGMSFWDSKEQWQSARPALAEVVKDDPFHEWEDVPPKVYHLEEV